MISRKANLTNLQDKSARDANLLPPIVKGKSSASLYMWVGNGLSGNTVMRLPENWNGGCSVR